MTGDRPTGELHLDNWVVSLKNTVHLQDDYECFFLVDDLTEARGTIFCLCEDPSKEAAQAVHREVHGGVVDETIEVKEGTQLDKVFAPRG